MRARLAVAIFSTLMEEAAIAVIVLLGLPRVGIQIPLTGLIVLMVAWGGFSVFIYQMGSRALRRKPVVGLPDMVSSTGKVVIPLAPDGVIRIKGELWDATSVAGNINTGEQVTVVGQEGLKLIVHKGDTGDLKATE
ncbi:MAG: NfeD family protein [Dehalococcoidales bacterium]